MDIIANYGWYLLISGCIFGFFMAWGIGANDVANAMGISTSVVLSAMDQPLGCAIGNALEIVESVETLCGRGPHDLEELVCVQGGILLEASGIVEDMDKGALMIHNSLNDSSAFTKFLEMVDAQGGNHDDFASDYSMLSSLGLLE